MKNKIFNWFTVAALVSVLAWGCSSEKVIEVDLPPYESQMVVECYLEPGKPMALTLFESVSYFSPPSLPIIQNAFVEITIDGVADTLVNGALIDPETGKLANYFSTNGQLPYSPGSNVELYIRDSLGREIRGQTTLMDSVSLDPIEVDFDDEGEASLTFRWPDFTGEQNHYFLTLNRDSLLGRLSFDFLLDDRIGDGEDFVVSTFYFLEPGDSVIASLYHIDESYSSYLNSVEDAQGSNGNPFAQPATILSNVEGGIGIFSNHALIRRGFRVPE